MWCEDCTLKEAFPGLYFLSRARDSSVAEVMCWIGGRIHWNFQFHGAPQDWEEDSFDQFMAIVLLSFPWRLLCQSKVPPRVAFFSWSASLGKIITTDNLCKRSIIVLD